MKKISLYIFAGLITGILFGAVLSRDKKAELRNPASLSWQGKHQRLFDIQINAISGLPDSDQKDTVLNAKIISMGPVSGEVFYKWVLPEGASLVSGEIEDSVVGLKEGQLLEKEISLQGVSQEGENKIVTLQVWMLVDGVKMGAAGVYATKPQEVQMTEPPTEMKTESQSTPHLPGFIQQ